MPVTEPLPCGFTEIATEPRRDPPGVAELHLVDCQTEIAAVRAEGKHFERRQRHDGPGGHAVDVGHGERGDVNGT